MQMASSDTFSIYVHHGGKFVSLGIKKEYVGGSLHSIHGLDADRYGYFDLEDEVEKLGYSAPYRMWFKVPKTDEYKLIRDDKEIVEITSHVVKDSKEFQVFVDDGKVKENYMAEEDVIDLEENIFEGACASSSESDGEEGVDLMQLELLNSSEDEDYNPMGESETDDGLSDSELVSDDEEYLEARHNKKNVPLTDTENLIVERKCSRVVVYEKLVSNSQSDVGDLGDFVGYISEYESSSAEVNSDSSHNQGDIGEVSGRRQKNKRMTYDPKCDHKSLKLVLGMRFIDGFQCKHAIQNISLEHGYPVHFTRCNKRQCEVKCIPECGWRCYGSIVKRDQIFLIKMISGEHKCPRDMHNKQATASWIANEYLEVIRDRPNIKIKEIQNDIMKRYACQVGKWRLYRAKWKALEKLRGSLNGHYGKLRSYIKELLRVDSEGRFELLLGDGGVFKAFYIGFSALRKCFLGGCRPIIGLDGCFLKTMLGGVLLCATSKDGNNQMYPIAWAVVEVENQACWTWFLSILFSELGIIDGLGFIIISDQQKGLINAVAELAPYAEHRNCARHIYSNWKKTYKGPTLKSIFWRAVRSTYVESYKIALEDMKAENEVAYLNFLEREPQRFCKSFISMLPLCDMVDNNISETFNGFIVQARGKHIINMLEDIRRQLMKRQYTKLEAICGVIDSVCPTIRARIEKLKFECRHYTSIPALDTIFEIHLGDHQFVVDIPNKTCTCRAWDLTGIPCIHACAAMSFLNVDPGEFVADFYTLSRYIEAYRFAIKPLNGPDMWPEADGYPVLPPLVKKMPGRPKKNRTRAPDEKDDKNQKKLKRSGLVQMTCGRCFQNGHNKRTCKNEAVIRPSKEPVKRGRPRKSVASASSIRRSEKQACNSNVENPPSTNSRRRRERAQTGNIHMRMPADKRVYFNFQSVLASSSRGRGRGQKSSEENRAGHGTQESRT